VRGVVLTPWPERPGAVERSNRETIAAIGRVEVATLRATSPDTLAVASSDLPLDAWMA
jgi:hypothetical protein